MKEPIRVTSLGPDEKIWTTHYREIMGLWVIIFELLNELLPLEVIWRKECTTFDQYGA